MSDIGGLLTIVVAALAILGAAGSVWAFLADRGNKARLDGLRSDITDRDVRIDGLRDDISDRNDRIGHLEDTVKVVTAANKAATAEVATLTRYVDGSAGTLKAIADLVQNHHETAVAGIATLEMTLADILRIVGDRRNVPPENITKVVNDG